MDTNTRWESFKADGDQIVETLRKAIHEGNVRRVLVAERNGRIVAEFPLTAGVVGIVAMPVLAAIGVLAAMLEGCVIKIERGGHAPCVGCRQITKSCRITGSEKGSVS